LPARQGNSNNNNMICLVCNGKALIGQYSMQDHTTSAPHLHGTGWLRTDAHGDYSRPTISLDKFLARQNMYCDQSSSAMHPHQHCIRQRSSSGKREAMDKVIYHFFEANMLGVGDFAF
jgi:hypothetical protein